MKLYYVYIVECADKSFYVGFTSNLNERILEHNAGYDEDSYTYKRRPVVLKWCEQLTDPNQAILLEKQLKGWSRRKKIALIEGSLQSLVEFSKNKWRKEKDKE